jgi:hypothetical protein
MVLDRKLAEHYALRLDFDLVAMSELSCYPANWTNLDMTHGTVCELMHVHVCMAQGSSGWRSHREGTDGDCQYVDCGYR